MYSQMVHTERTSTSEDRSGRPTGRAAHPSRRWCAAWRARERPPAQCLTQSGLPVTAALPEGRAASPDRWGLARAARTCARSARARRTRARPGTRRCSARWAACRGCTAAWSTACLPGWRRTRWPPAPPPCRRARRHPRIWDGGSRTPVPRSRLEQSLSQFGVHARPLILCAHALYYSRCICRTLS